MSKFRISLERKITWYLGDLCARFKGLFHPLKYQPIESDKYFNAILTDEARSFYSKTIFHLGICEPSLLAKKIPRANVQQAFIFDSVVSLASNIKNPKVLCVGCYEDTAYLALLKAGFSVVGVDPLINSSLEEYAARSREVFDIVFSTSVIEHVRNDENFVRLMAKLCKPGGTIVLTCDYRSDYLPGNPLPMEDERFYTEKDLAERLLKSASNGRLSTVSRWADAINDFNYGGCDYCFATWVVKK